MKQNTIRGLELLFKLALFFLAFGIVVFAIINLKLFGGDWQRYFFLTDNYFNLIQISLLVFVFSYILKKLLIWMWKLEFKPKPRRTQK